eukprot:PLAT5697.1.p2 GENE.PLAT5697.1~~PLAT5697.1.p2  ORF type:complete len:156 (+),score=27.88 PLAT5697.1:31-468(+)
MTRLWLLLLVVPLAAATALRAGAKWVSPHLMAPGSPEAAFCKHYTACGDRNRFGPAVDSVYDGIHCYCQGNIEPKRCYRGTCVKQHGVRGRPIEDEDSEGNCLFFEPNPDSEVDIEVCDNKQYEEIDPAQRYFTDPPPLYEKEDD